MAQSVVTLNVLGFFFFSLPTTFRLNQRCVLIYARQSAVVGGPVCPGRCMFVQACVAPRSLLSDQTSGETL